MAFNYETSDLKGFRREIKSVALQITRVQDRIHYLGLAAGKQWLEHNNPDWIIELVDGIRKYQGLGAVSIWFKDMLGCNVSIADDGSVKASKNKKFDWDQTPVAIFSKAKSVPFFKLVDSEKPLKLSQELKATAFTVTAARGLEAGVYSVEEVQRVINSLQAEIDKKRKDPDLQDWVKKYQAQVESVATH